jgi:hypothetical protein
MMKRNILLLLGLLFTASITFGQDFVLDPIEQQPETPTSYEQATGNWGAVTMGTTENYDEIKDKGSRPVAVFIFDTANRFDHPSVKPYSGEGRVFTGEPFGPDKNGHGTHVASSVGGVHPQGLPLGVAGPLAEQGLLVLYPYEVLGDNGSGTYASVAAGINYANNRASELIEEGWFVVYNFSLGGGGSNSAITSALKQARDIGVYVCTASGNNGGAISFPGSDVSSRAIGAVYKAADGTLKRANFSNFGPKLFAAGPGVGIYGAWGSGYSNLSGTSMATPHIAGYVAVLASIYPDLTNTDIDAYIKAHSMDISPAGWDQYTGWGVPLVSTALDTPPSDNPDPDPNPDPNPDPEPDEPTDVVKPRMVYYQVDGLPVIWRRGGEQFRKTELSLVVGIEHGNYSEARFAEVDSLVRSYLSPRRGFQLRSWDGELAAGYFAGYFLDKIYLTRQLGYKVDLLNGHVVSGTIDAPLTEEYLNSNLLKVGPLKRGSFFARIFKRKAIKKLSGDIPITFEIEGSVESTLN